MVRLGNEDAMEESHFESRNENEEENESGIVEKLLSLSRKAADASGKISITSRLVTSAHVTSSSLSLALSAPRPPYAVGVGK